MALAVACGGAILALVAFEAVRTAPVRESVRVLSGLVDAGNRGDLERARSLCSRDVRRRAELERAPEGGIVGLPRSIRRGFRAWREEDSVLICPTGRSGPVYRFIREGGEMRFDGVAGVLGRSPIGPP
jgi:hypothetical protein